MTSLDTVCVYIYIYLLREKIDIKHLCWVAETAITLKLIYGNFSRVRDE